MAWDKNRPVGGAGLNVGDDAIRENFEWLDLTLPTQLVFPGTTTTRGRPKVLKGNKSARTAILDPAEGMFFLRTDVAPGALEVFEGSSWVRRAGPQVGDIKAYSGNPANLATDRPGWALCDGSIVNGFTTPNLKGRFVVGYDAADGDYNAIGDVGGAKTTTLAIANLPAHSHPGTPDTGNTSLGANVFADTFIFETTVNTGSQGSSASSSHTHTVTVASEGSGQAFDQRPPYYALAWIVFVDVP